MKHSKKFYSTWTSRSSQDTKIFKISKEKLWGLYIDHKFYKTMKFEKFVKKEIDFLLQKLK
jgi:hypothetical protein